MAEVLLERVTIEFPLLQVAHRSLKKRLVATATGGKIVSDPGVVTVVRALNDVSGSFHSGDRVGLIGPNGAGKTTLLRAIAGIYEPTSGHVHTEGRIMSLIDIAVGFNHDMTGRENIRLRGMYMGLRPKEIARLAPEIEEFTELGDYLEMPIRTYSTGMQLRLSFAIATCVQPDILLMDEWMLAGDASFMAKAQARLTSFVQQSNILFLASHSDAVIRQWCNKAILLIGGEVRSVGAVDEVVEAYEQSRKAA